MRMFYQKTAKYHPTIKVKYAVKWCAFILILSSSSKAISQKNTDFFSLNYATIPSAEFKNKEVQAKLQQLDVSLITPTLKWGAKTRFNNILNYRYSDYSYSLLPIQTQVLPEDFQEIKYTLIARRDLGSHWEMLLVPRVSIRSDFEDNLTYKDIFPGISTIFIKTSTKNVNKKWGIGLNYNNDLGKNSVIPIVAFNYLSEQLRCNVFFPNNANVSFTSIKKLEYGFAFTTEAALIHLNDPNSAEYLRTLNVHLYPTFSYNVLSNVWLNLKAGWVMRRKFDLYNSDFEVATSDDENQLQSTGFWQLGISLRTKK